MDLEKLNQRLESTGLPVAYWSFPEGEAPPLPWICYIVTGSNNFVADGTVFYQIQHVDVELYTERKEPAVQALVEQALTGIPWQKSERYLDDERCYEVIYEIEV